MSKDDFYTVVISQNELDVVLNALVFFENEHRLDGVQEGSEESKQYHRVVAVREFFQKINDKDKP
jgi:hypothetical protein